MALKAYNSEVAQGVPYLTALKNTMSEASTTAQNLAKNAKGAAVDINAIPKASKAAAIGMKALSIAGNMLLFAAISKGIQWLMNLFDTFVVSVDEAKESLEAFKQVSEDLTSTENELEEINKRIDEINSKTTLSITDQADLSRLKEEKKLLESQVELLKIKKELAGTKSNSDAIKATNSMWRGYRWQGGSFQSNHSYIQNLNPNTFSFLESEIQRMQDDYNQLSDSEIDRLYMSREHLLSMINIRKSKITNEKLRLSEIALQNQELLGQITGEDLASVAAREKLQNEIDIINQYLYTAEELQKMKFDGFLNENEKIKKSFDDLSNNGANVTADNIENLANKFPTLKSYMDENGISAETLVAEFAKVSDEAENSGDNINEMTVLLSDLKDASDSIATLQKAFDEMSEDGYITTETLSKIKEAVGDNIDNWDKYQQKLLTAKKGSAEFKQILSDLTYAIIENKFETAGLENATEEEVTAILRENGVLNASEVAHDMVTRAKIEAGLEAIAFAQANGQATDSLYEEMKGLGLTESALQSLVTAYIDAQNSMTEAAKESVRSRLLLTEAEFSSISSVAEAEALALSKDNSYIDGDPAATRAYLNALKQAKAYGAAQEKVKELLDKVVGETQTKYSSSKSSSDKDKPDKADPTDAIINRIGAPVEALERQGEAIDNQIDMVDAEKEYDKYVELTNKALDNRLKTIEASKTAQNELSKEAQKIRNKYKGIDIESFFHADGGFTEAYDKYYDSFGSKAKQEAFANDMKMIQAFKKAWFEYYDDIMGLEKEVFDLRKDLQEAHYDHLSNLIDQLERHADLREKQAEDDKEYYDYLIDKEQALLDMKKAQFGLENKLSSARREAEKALATSKIGSEYLDEETRKLVYNDDDYKLEIDKINEISDYVNDLTKDYISDLNQLGEDEMYKAEEITAQYERRIAIKEKELEIVQAEINLQKKQDTLNNVLAEKNIRQIVDGKWVWTHDTDQLRQATEDLADAKAQVEQLEREKTQLEYTNSLEARIGQWQLEQEAIDRAMEHLRDKIDDFSTKVELLEEPLKNFADLINELTAELGGETVGDESGNVIKASLSSVPNAGRIGSIDPNADMDSTIQQMKNNSIMWHVSDSATKEKLHEENKNLGASIGADYNPADGKYYQNGKPLYDSGGVLKGLGGIKATEKDEVVLSPSLTEKILKPESNIMFDRFANNLETIFDFSKFPIQQIPFNVPKPNMSLLDTTTNKSSIVNYNMNGDVHITEADSYEELLRILINKIKSMPIPN